MCFCGEVLYNPTLMWLRYRCERVADNIAETPGDLMFLTGDEIIVLKELEGDHSYLVRLSSGGAETHC